MDDTYRRLAILEAALAELGVNVDPGTLDTVARCILGSIDSGEDQEVAIRLGALALLGDLQRRPGEAAGMGQIRDRTKE